MYNEKLMQIFSSPKNVGIIKGADGVGEATNALGEVSKIFINVEDGKIAESKFKAYGNVVVIAASSVMTLVVKDKTIEEAINITNEDIIDALGGNISDEDIQSIVVVKDALLLAIKNYKDKQLVEG